MDLSTVEIKAFVPAKDFELSKEFYRAIGFEIPWSDEQLAYLKVGGTSFLLQRFHIPEHSQNFQMHLLVSRADDWHAHITNADVAQRFGTKIGPLQDQPWGMREFTLHDPTGVLWRIAQNIP